MQIYGILLNICGILLNNRGKTEKNGEFRGILWNFHGKCVENHSFLFLFFPFHSSNSCQLTHFRGRFRSFSVVFAVIPGENQRKSENIGDIFPFSFLFFPLHYNFIPHFQITPILCSKTYSLQILLKFLAFFLAVPDFLLTFANA